MQMLRDEAIAGPKRARIGVVRAAAAVAMATIMLGALVPAHATTSFSATITTPWPPFLNPTESPDFAQFVAQKCVDVRNGTMEALLDATPMRGKFVTFSVVSAQQGGPNVQALRIFVGFYGCMDPGVASAHWSEIGTATPGHAITRSIGTTAQIVVLWNINQAVGLTYHVSY